MLVSMKNKICIYLILSFFCLIENLWANPVITLFFKPYNTHISHDDSKKLTDKLKKPGKIAKINVKALNLNPIIKGILATYAGYIASSNNDGQISFPKKHILPIVYLLITDKITPILIAGNTIHHWEIAQPHKAKMYKVERIHNEAEQVYYWDIAEVSLPTNNRVPLESITILKKPSHIHVEEGITLTDDNINLILPTIFVKKGTNVHSALYILNVRQFFGHSSPLYKKGTKRYLTLTP